MWLMLLHFLLIDEINYQSFLVKAVFFAKGLSKDIFFHTSYFLMPKMSIEDEI